jgi:putative spermidine/putrescine transport system ATP-binding protein
VELKQIQREVGITFVFVTHDQEEALTMSDRVAVFDQGRIQQVGTPQEIYETPGSQFVAGFVGTSNLLTGQVAETVLGRAGTFVVRPEKLELGSQPARPVADGHVAADGTVAEVVYAGAVTRYLVDLDAGAQLTAATSNHGRDVDVVQRGDRVSVSFARQHCLELETSA